MGLARSNYRKPPALQVCFEAQRGNDPGTPGLRCPYRYAEIDPEGDGIRKNAAIGEKRMNAGYAVIFEQADANWAAYVPDLPGCVGT